MEEAVEGGRGRWSTAVGLTVAVLALAVFDALALVLLPLALLFVGLPGERRLLWLLAGTGLVAGVFLTAGGPLALLSRGWGLTLAAVFLITTVARPDWSVTSRALAAVGATIGFAGGGLLVTGRAAELDALVRNHLATVSAVTIGDLQSLMPQSEWLADLRTASAQVAQLQADMFPALLALQSIAGLSLATWWVRRLGRSHGDAFRLGSLRDFRFNDQLIWVLIASVVILLMPMNATVDRLALNALVVMAALYALRGVAIFVFLAAGSRSVATMVLGALAFIFLYPVALTAALMMGVGDTWLDVRRRLEPASPS